MTAVNNELIKAAVARSCDSIPPQQAQIVTVFVSGSTRSIARLSGSSTALC